MLIVKKTIFVLLSVALPCGVSVLGNPASAQISGLPAMLVLALSAFLIQWLAFIPARILETERFYDVVGSSTYIVLTLAALHINETLMWSQILIAIFVIIWASRLGVFLFRRIHLAGGDQRFNQIKISSGRFFVAWTLQGAWIVMTICAALAAILSEGAEDLLAIYGMGVVLWLIGFATEVIADRQKSKFRKNPENAKKFINTGLWARSRHPNYFGEILLWSGIAIMTIPVIAGMQWFVMLSPVFVYALLTRGSGIPMLARRGEQLWGDSPAYQIYLKQTPRLIPRLW